MEPTITQSLQADPKNAETTLRAKVHTGFGCNANCVFCYYHALLRTQNLPVELLNEEVRLARRLGYKDVDFEGGEPTIVPNIEKPISLAKELGFRRISVITNGLALSNEKFYAKLVDAGLNETLFSLHGYPSDVHDSLVRVPGAFQRVSSAMKIAKELGVVVRTNITINNLNYKGLKEYVDYVLKFEPENINFIFLNPWTTEDVDAKKLFVRYSDAMPRLSEALKVAEGSPVKVAIRYVPYCVVPEEYRKFVMSLRNRYLDPYEWGYPFSAFTERIAHMYIRRKRDKPGINVSKEWIKYRVAVSLYNAVMLAKYEPSLAIEGLISRERGRANDTRFSYQQFRKTKACSNCAMKDICDGIKRDYLEEYGDSEFKGISGATRWRASRYPW